MTNIDGTYCCLSAVIDGKPLDAEVASQLQLTLEGELYRTAKGSQTLFSGRFSVNHETRPVADRHRGHRRPSRWQAGARAD